MAVFTLPVETVFLIKVLADFIRLQPLVEELEPSPQPRLPLSGQRGPAPPKHFLDSPGLDAVC